MQRNYTLLTLLTAFIVAAAVYSNFVIFKTAGLPVQIHIVDTHTATLEPIAGIPLPAGIQAGDQIELAAQPRPTRDAISINMFSAVQGASLSLYALRMKAKARIVEALAQAPVTALPQIQIQARTLLSAEAAG